MSLIRSALTYVFFAAIIAANLMDGGLLRLL